MRFLSEPDNGVKQKAKDYHAYNYSYYQNLVEQRPFHLNLRGLSESGWYREEEEAQSDQSGQFGREEQRR
jgi:hypothetical protein